MSCGQIALERAGIKVDNYYASEIDKYAMQVSKANYPNTQYIGSVVDVKASELPKIDLLIGGSPCQGFSFAGKQLNFDDPRSKLFFEYVRLLNECKPKYFLLENVRMKKEFQDVISSYLGVEPIMINSSLVSAQNRVRLYWTNIPNIIQPEDKEILLKDILENDYADRDKSFCLDANYFRGGNLKSYFEKHRRQLVFSKVLIDSSVKPSVANNIETYHNEIIESDKDFYTMKVASGFQDNKIGIKKSVTLRSGNSCAYAYTKAMYRKLTPIECERLQTVPDNYTSGVSNTQRYKMLGNGWTVDVITHILKNIKEIYVYEV